MNLREPQWAIEGPLLAGGAEDTPRKVGLQQEAAVARKEAAVAGAGIKAAEVRAPPGVLSRSLV